MFVPDYSPKKNDVRKSKSKKHDLFTANCDVPNDSLKKQYIAITNALNI